MKSIKDTINEAKSASISIELSADEWDNILNCVIEAYEMSKDSMTKDMAKKLWPKICGALNKYPKFKERGWDENLRANLTT